MNPKRLKAEMESSNRMDISSPEFKTDDFRMYGLKVIECSKRHSHDWTNCPFAHPNEKARRRDPRKVNYTGVACPFIKQEQECPYGDFCPYAHNVFEYWLHPSRYRTQLCNIAASCDRNVCFFAHSIDELRVPLPIGNPEGMHFGRSIPNLDHSMFMSPGHYVNESTRDIAGHTNFSCVDMSFTARARHILDQLMAARHISSQLEPGGSSDIHEIQTLINLLNSEQRMAGISDINPIQQSQFLNALFAALFEQLSINVRQASDREKLSKLFRWFYVQVLQNKQHSFAETATATDYQNLYMGNPNTTHSMISHQPLSRIPESVEASPIPLVAQTPNFNSQWDGNNAISLISWPNYTRSEGGTTNRGSGGAAIGSTGELRTSGDSAGTRVSGNARLSTSSVNRSSNESFQSFDPFLSIGTSTSSVGTSTNTTTTTARNPYPSHHHYPHFGGIISIPSSIPLQSDTEDASPIPEFIYYDWINQRQNSNSGN